MKKLVEILATGLYSGYSPKASGTAGSIAWCLIAWLIWQFFPDATGLGASTAIALIVCLLSFPITHLYLKNLAAGGDSKHLDPKEVVIDEWAGMALALIWCQGSLQALAIAFVLFRIFDVLKPWPVSALEKLGGTAGVVLDDIAAGLIALFIGLIIYVNCPALVLYPILRACF